MFMFWTPAVLSLGSNTIGVARSHITNVPIYARSDLSHQDWNQDYAVLGLRASLTPRLNTMCHTQMGVGVVLAQD